MIKLVNVKKNINNRCLLNDVSLYIGKEEFVIITGPSGEGKTTLLNIIGLLDGDYSGSLFFNGIKISQEMQNKHFEIRRKIGYVFQNALINDNQTVYRNLTLPSLIVPVPDINERVSFLLQKTGLSGFENQKGIVLSGGEKQRLSVARAVFHSPLVLLADEPTASLDHENKKKVIDFLESINREHRVTVIVVTHDLDYFMDKRKVSLKNGILYEE
ncbi:ABC transporter ATP-binding protein [Salmonella enterica]|nr:ABC transporter ATP-binding protein [Salmonella enterica]EJM4070145.1 ABC transporter ATP-binding protein [Salmonella enterica]